MKNKENVIEIHIPSVLGYEKVAMDSAAAIAEIMHFHKNRVEDLRTAVSEACLNAMEHGNRLNTSMAVLVTLKMGKSSLEVNVKDDGKGMADNIPQPSIDTQIASCDDDPRGWGVFLIKSLVDEYEFKKIPQGGNITKMVIHLNREKEV